MKTETEITSAEAKALLKKMHERSAWNIRQWEIKDPEGLKQIKDISPITYDKMKQTFYKK